MNLSTYLLKINNKLDMKTLNKSSFIKYNEINTKLLKIFDNNTDTNKKIYFLTQLGGDFKELQNAVLDTKRLLSTTPPPTIDQLKAQNALEEKHVKETETNLNAIYTEYNISE